MQQYETISLFLLGGAAYVGLELAWRGTSHWTMFFAGGICLCYLAWLSLQPRLALLPGAACGALGISAVELVFGMLCTHLLRHRVWDYSREWGNVAGLICPKYTLLWFALCIWLLWAMRALRAVME